LCDKVERLLFSEGKWGRTFSVRGESRELCYQKDLVGPVRKNVGGGTGGRLLVKEGDMSKKGKKVLTEGEGY